MGPGDERPLFHKHKKICGSEYKDTSLKHHGINEIVNFIAKDDFKYINFNESVGFHSVGRAQGVFHSSYLMEIPWGDPCLKT